MKRPSVRSCKQPAFGRLFAFATRANRGFTLLEIMAVLVIIGIVLTFVTLSTGGGGRVEQMQREANRLAALLALAKEEAIMRGEQLALRVGENDYEFMTASRCAWNYRIIRHRD